MRYNWHTTMHHHVFYYCVHSTFYFKFLFLLEFICNMGWEYDPTLLPKWVMDYHKQLVPYTSSMFFHWYKILCQIFHRINLFRSLVVYFFHCTRFCWSIVIPYVLDRTYPNIVFLFLSKFLATFCFSIILLSISNFQNNFSSSLWS